MNFTVKNINDPFKKYWWVLLLIFGFTGAWVCMPLMDTSVGSGTYSGESRLKTANQSLDSVANPQGAPGGAVDLSMDGAYRRKKGDSGTMTSSLYQAPAEAAAPGAPIAPGASASFAAALKDVSRKSDASGWGGAAPQKGFSPPKGNFSGLSGFGGGSGGGTGASLSMGAFGTAKANTGFATTRGLGAGDGGPQASGPNAAMNALRNAKAQGLSAAGQKTGDAASAMAGGSFDGRGAGSAILGGQGQSIGGGGLDNLDAAPANLKPNDPNANSFLYEPVPEVVAPMDTSEEQKRQLMIMMAGALIGGMVGGTAGQMISMAMMMYSVTSGRSQNSGSNVSGQTKKTTFYQPIPRRTYGPATRYS